ncbi:M16 family metallopeptidase [Streptomyces sp. NPDC059761]|uniref:M16 family metallopeptidase n=1 Tax=unclassified Streptomyces TaxID=2593676 RepID=UPI00364EF69C
MTGPTEPTELTDLTDLTLPNGMRVLLQPLPGCQVVATCLHVGTGFRNEPVAGAAHLLEHVLVQGSTADGPLTAAVTAMGGTMNARTSADHTQYTQILPADGLELGLRIERDRLTEPDLSPEHIRGQIAVVQAEIRRNVLQRPHGGLVLFDLPALLHDTWENRHNGYGDIEALQSLGSAELRTFFERSYSPGNIHLAVVGDFDPERARELVERLLGPVPARPTWQREPAVEPPLTESRYGRRAEQVAPAGRTVLGWRVPDPEAAPADHLATVLLSELLETVGGDCGRHGADAHPWGAFRARVNRTGNPFDVARASLFAVEFPHPVETSPDAAEDCLRSVFARIADGSLPVAEPLATLRRRLAMHLHAELDSVAGQASWLGVGAAVHGDPGHLAGLPAAVDAVSAADVARLAAVYAKAPAARITSLPGAAAPVPDPMPTTAGAPA